jgi:hypothetical protein
MTPSLKTKTELTEQELFDEILINIVKYDFNYTFNEGGIKIYSNRKEVLCYKYLGLIKQFRNYLLRRFSEK